MKDSWVLYGYLIRWWRLLLVFCVVGALAAHFLDDPPDFPADYTGTATVAIRVPDWSFEDPGLVQRATPPVVMATLTSSIEPSRQLAIDDVQSQMRRIAAFGPTLVASHGIIIDEKPQGVWQWWKAVVLGSVLGGLLAVGCIYVWEDAKEYRRQAHQKV